MKMKILGVITVLLAALAMQADTINIAPTGPNFTIGTGLFDQTTGPTGVLNSYVFTPLYSDEVACFYLANRGIGSVSYTVTTSYSPDASGSLFGQLGNGVTQFSIQSVNPVSGGNALASGLDAGNIGVVRITSPGAALITVQISATTGGASRKTDLYLTQVNNAQAGCALYGLPGTDGNGMIAPAGTTVTQIPSTASSGIPNGQTNSPVMPECSVPIPGSILFGPCPVITYAAQFNGQTWDKWTAPAIYKTCTATAAGSTACWTPSAGKKFRLQGYCLDVTGNASLAAGAVLTIDLQDSATSTASTWSVFVPGVAGAVLTGSADTCNQSMANGLLSATVNNVLNVNLSAALVTGLVRVRLWGNEE